MKIGATMLVGYLRHAYEFETSGLGRPSVLDRRGRERAIAAAAKVCVGMTDEQIVAVARREASIVGYHPLGMTFVTEDVTYDPALHDGGPIWLIEDPA